MWAKNRAADLEEEIRREMSVNVESVGLEMAIREEWILDQLGIAPPLHATGRPKKCQRLLFRPNIIFRVGWPTSFEASNSQRRRRILRVQQPVICTP